MQAKRACNNECTKKCRTLGAMCARILRNAQAIETQIMCMAVFKMADSTDIHTKQEVSATERNLHEFLSSLPVKYVISFSG